MKKNEVSKESDTHNPWFENSKTNTFSIVSKVEIDYLLRHYLLMKLARLGVLGMKILFKEE